MGRGEQTQQVKNKLNKTQMTSYVLLKVPPGSWNKLRHFMSGLLHVSGYTRVHNMIRALKYSTQPGHQGHQ